MRFPSIRYKRLSRLLATLALLIAAVVVNASQKPTRAELEAITERGRLLAEYDAAAWHATDAMLATHPKEGSSNRYIAHKTEAGWVVDFGRLSTAGDKFLVVVAFVGTRAANTAAALGIQEAMAGWQAAAEAGSWEEVVSIARNTAKLIVRTKPVVRSLLCAPVGIVYNLAVDQLNEYAAAHKWNWAETKAMYKALDWGEGTILTACGVNMWRSAQ